MLRLAIPTAVLFALFACNSENTLDKPVDGGGEVNPPDLPPQSQTDVIVQTTIPSVDVLYVIDNSCSMSDKQAQLSQNFPRFMQYFVDSGLDFHIGVVSTDMDYAAPGNQGVLVPAPQSGGLRYIDNAHPAAVTAFQNMAVLGINGSSTEKGRAPAFTALELKRNTQNAGFVRDGAVQHIIFVSDELDQSFNNPVSKNEFVNWMRGFKGVPEQTIAHSIVGLPQGGGAAGCYSEIDPVYAEYANVTGGVKFNICARADQWPGFLDELGLQASGLKREFFLSQQPVPDSIVVRVRVTDPETLEAVTYTFHQDPELNPAFLFTYQQSRNSIAFAEFLPDPFSEVEIEYRLLASTQTVDDLF